MGTIYGATFVCVPVAVEFKIGKIYAALFSSITANEARRPLEGIDFVECFRFFAELEYGVLQ